MLCHFGIIVRYLRVYGLYGVGLPEGVEVGAEELFHRVRVPLVDRQRLLHHPLLVHEVDDRIRPSNVLDFEVWESRGFLAFDKSLNLGISTQSSSAHFQPGKVVLFGHFVDFVVDAAGVAAALQIA